MLQVVSEPTLAVTRACAGQWRTCGAWRVWPGVDTAWHMCRHWTHKRMPRGDVPDLWLIDEDIDLLRVGVCETLAHGSIGLIGNPYQ